MKQPVDHIMRPCLPWRREEDVITECGYDATKVKALTRDEYAARFKDWGRQRTSLMTCITCMETNRRYARWSDDPRQAMQREIEWETSWGRGAGREQRLKDELFAIAGLIEAHREEFDSAVKLRKDKQAWLDQKAASAARARHKPREPGGL